MKNILYLLLLFCSDLACQAQESYFSKFRDIEYLYNNYNDSIQCSIVKKNEKIIGKIKTCEFVINFNNQDLVFTIGIGDSTLYSFKGGKLEKPVKLFSFGDKKKIKNIPFYPFCETYEIDVEQFYYSNGEPYASDDDLYCFYLTRKKRNYKLGEITLLRIYLSLKEGAGIAILHKGLIYSSLK